MIRGTAGPTSAQDVRAAEGVAVGLPKVAQSPRGGARPGGPPARLKLALLRFRYSLGSDRARFIPSFIAFYEKHNAMGSATGQRPPVLVYSISAAALYGTERVTIETLVAFAKERPVLLICPLGPAVDLARSKGIETRVYDSIASKALLLWRLSWTNPHMRFVTISVVDSYLYSLVRALQLRSLKHVHVIHGSGFPARSYLSKRYLRGMPVDVVAVSEYAKERLCEFSGLKRSRIAVIENFVSATQLQQTKRRSAYGPGTNAKKIIVISRVEKPKRIDVLLDALETYPEQLKNFCFDVFGTGPELEPLRARAAAARIPESQLVFHGFQPNVSARIHQYDALLHLCPIEPFGIVYLEAMSAGVVAIGPDKGSNVLKDGATGFLFGADDPQALAQVLNKIRKLDSESLNRISDAARRELHTRFSERRAVDEYRHAIGAT